jgi:hypothetical protein
MPAMNMNFQCWPEIFALSIVKQVAFSHQRFSMQAAQHRRRSVPSARIN